LGESGRSLPSQNLLLAGYAPACSAARLDDPVLAQTQRALAQWTATHDPMPGPVMDTQWNLLQRNRGGQWLAAKLVPWAAGLPQSGQTSGRQSV